MRFQRRLWYTNRTDTLDISAQNLDASSLTGRGNSPSTAPIALTIAGFDPSSGAGVSADLAVFAAFGVFGTAAITTSTVQSTRGVFGRSDSSAEHLQAVLETLDADLPPRGIKIGALGNADLAQTLENWLDGRKKNISIVWDPALVSTSGAPLLDPEALDTLRSGLLRQITWATPNRAELAALASTEVHSEADAVRVADAFAAEYPGLGLVMTGGDADGPPIDLVRHPNGRWERIVGERVASTSTHGTGCAFSSAMLAGLIHGRSPRESIAAAKFYVTEAIRRAPKLGSGRGPLDLYWPLR